MRSRPVSHGDTGRGRTLAGWRVSVGEKRKILVIDDEAVMRDGCCRILDNEGCEVLTASNGEEGLAAIKADPQGFEVVLLDLKMPGMGGMEVLDQAREINPALLIVVVTGYATVDTAVEAMKKGAYDFIPKPFTPDQLRLIVNRALEKRRLELEAAQLRAEAARSLRDVATEKSKVKTIVHCMADGILVTDREGRIVLINPAAGKMLGVETTACLEKPLSEAIGDAKLIEAVGGVVEPVNPEVTVISQELQTGDSLIRASVKPARKPSKSKALAAAFGFMTSVPLGRSPQRRPRPSRASCWADCPSSVTTVIQSSCSGKNALRISFRMF